MKSTRKNNPLAVQFEQFARDHRLFKKGDSILVAVSGGADSMVLFHLFLSVRIKLKLRLAVIHLHHDLRGKEADADEAFVISMTRKAGIPFFGLKADIRSSAGRHGYSVEEAGRLLRFQYFRKTAYRLAFDRVALAHHADDQAETILMHLFRGTGLRGLAGMKPVREDKIIHPLLFVTRSRIEAYAEQVGLAYRNDSSNSDIRFLRNRIRREVLPVVKGIYGSSVIGAITRAGQAVSEAEDRLEAEIREAMKQGTLMHKNHEFILDIPRFLRYFITIQKGLLMVAVRQIRNETPYVKNTEIERLMCLIHRGTENSKVELNHGISAIRSNHQIVFTRCIDFAVKPRQVPINRWIVLPELQGKIRISSLSADVGGLRYLKNSNIEYLDGSMCEDAFWIRTWREGDRFTPLGMESSKKLQDFFVDLKIRRRFRKYIPLLEMNGEIVWVVGHRISNRFRVKPDTNKIVQCEWKSFNDPSNPVNIK